MEKLTLNKEEIFNCLKRPLEEFYDIELDDLILGEYFDRRTVFLIYYIMYRGERQKTILPLCISDFLAIAKTAIESRKHLVGTNVVILPGDELKCRVNYRLTDFNCARRRRR